MEVKALKEQRITSPDTAVSDVEFTDASDRKKTPLPLDGLKFERRTPSPVPTVDELDEIIKRITDVQTRQTTWTPDFVAKQAESEKIYLVIDCCRFLFIISHARQA